MPIKTTPTSYSKPRTKSNPSSDPQASARRTGAASNVNPQNEKDKWMGRETDLARSMVIDLVKQPRDQNNENEAQPIWLLRQWGSSTGRECSNSKHVLRLRRNGALLTPEAKPALAAAAGQSDASFVALDTITKEPQLGNSVLLLEGEDFQFPQTQIRIAASKRTVKTPFFGRPSYEQTLQIKVPENTTTPQLRQVAYSYKASDEVIALEWKKEGAMLQTTLELKNQFGPRGRTFRLQMTNGTYHQFRLVA